MANLKGRAEIKSKFEAFDIPTADDFADLINSQLNQIDDGLFTSTRPISIVASSDNKQSLIKFYRSTSALPPTDAPDWLISLSALSGTVEGNGFRLADKQDNTRLFINASTGNVGIGTFAPMERLHVAQGNLRVDGGLIVGSEASPRFFIDPSSGNVGLGSCIPSKKLHVAGGDVLIEGALSIRPKKIGAGIWMNLDIDMDNGIHLGVAGHQDPPDRKETRLYIEPLSGNLFIGGKAETLCVQTVNQLVGVGTFNPEERLHVYGGGLLVQGGSVKVDGGDLSVGGDGRITGQLLVGAAGKLLPPLPPVRRPMWIGGNGDLRIGDWAFKAKDDYLYLFKTVPSGTSVKTLVLARFATDGSNLQFSRTLDGSDFVPPMEPEPEPPFG